MVLVSGVRLARRAFESEAQGEFEPQLDSLEEAAFILVFSLFGVFGAQLMPHVAQTPATTEIDHLTKLHYPNKTWMNGTRPFSVQVYVDGFFRVEAALEDRSAQAKLSNRRIIHEFLAISLKKATKWEPSTIYIDVG